MPAWARISLAFVAVAGPGSGSEAVGQNLTKANTATMNTATDWGGTAPTLSGTGVFTNVLSASNAAALTLGGDMSLFRLEFQNINGPVTIAAGGTLTLANASNATNAGIQMNNANLNHDVTINAALANVGTLNVKAGRTLTLGGGATNIGASLGMGSVVLRTGSYAILSTANLNVGDVSNPQTTGLLVGDNAVVTDLRNVGRAGSGVFRVNGLGAIVSSTSTQDVSVGRDAGSRGLLQLDQGTLTIGRNVFLGFSGTGEGTLRVNGGTLNVTSVLTVGSGSSSFEMIGGVAYFGATGAIVASAGTVALAGGTMGATNNWTSAADMRLGTTNGSVTFQAASASGTARNITLSGVLSNNGAQAGGLIKTASGTLTLSNANTFSGDTRVDAGTLALANANAIQNSTLDVGAGTVAFTVAGTNTYALAGLKGSGTVGLGVNSISVGAGNTNTTFAGVLSGSAASGLIKVGSGALTLNGASPSFSGTTAITGGRLEIGSTGQINGTSGITINGLGAELKYNSATALSRPITFTQGTLSGTGTISTAVTAGANGILSPGNSPGAQSFTSGLTWDPAGTYLWEINNATSTSGTGWDIINVSGGSGLAINATSGTTFKIAITSLSGTAPGNAANFSATTSGSWTILSSASGITGFAANKFNLDRSAFTNTTSGSFTISQVASGGNQTLVLAYNTISALSSSTSSVTGFRVMQGQATTTAVNLLNAGPDATGYSLSPSGALSLVSSSTGTLAGSGTQAITFGYTGTGTTGARSGTVSFTNMGNSGDAGGSVSVSGAVVANRVVTASAVDFGLVHLGASGTATSTFTSTGSDNDFTRITVNNGTGGGLTVDGSSAFVFNGSGGSSRTVAGTFATAGALSGTISLTNGSAEAGNALLPGQVPGTTGLAYSASVFSGTATWNVAGGGSWGSGASSSWTSTGGVQASPGTFTGYSNTDVAIFAGTQGGTSTVLLNGAAPSLAAISFTNATGRYVLDQGSGGSLTLAASSTKPTIDVVAGGLHEIKTAILGSGGLSKIGAGTLVLSGSNGFTGGTDVTAGMLAINGSLGGAVNVASGAILGGTGALNGLVTVTGGGILAPGNSPGTLTMNAGLVLADASVLNFELSATDFTVGGGINDLIHVNGTFTLDGVLNVTGLGDFATVADNTKWRLFNYDTGGTFTNNGLSLGAMPSVGASGKYFQIDTATAGQVNLVIVPEPAAIAIAGIGVALAAWSLRRRRTDAA